MIAGQSKRKQPAGSGDSPATRVAEFLVAAILDFGILDPDTILPVLESIRANRVIKMERLVGIPVAIARGREEYAMERLMIVGGRAAGLLRKLRDDKSSQAYLDELAVLGREKLATMLSQIESGIVLPDPQTQSLKLKELIEAACQVAITRMPTSILAHRSGLIVSHALKLSVLERIGRYSKVPAFPKAEKVSARKKKLEEPNEGEERAEEEDGGGEDDGCDPAWMVELRAAVKKTGIDRPRLQALAKTSEICGRRMGEYALYLAGKDFSASTIQRYVFLIVNRLLPRFRDGDDPSGVDQDAWEDVVEQVLDHDAFYHRKSYSRGEERDRAGYSCPLLEALRTFVQYLNHPREDGKRVKSMVPPAGLVRVEAAFITCDEYREALDWFKGIHADHQKVRLNSACRAALILGFRCGLRRAEAAYLRVCDFDDLLKGRSACDSNVHLHVRPWFLRGLKTSNARRDLPLRALMHEWELNELMDFVAEARERGGPEALLFAGVRKEGKPGEFGQVIGQLNDVFRGKGRWEAIVKDYHTHLLRHSFLNICALRLTPALGKVAQIALRGHPETLEFIADSAHFRKELFGGERTGGSDFQALALLAGHGSAATSIEHYIHILDWYRPE